VIKLNVVGFEYGDFCSSEEFVGGYLWCGFVGFLLMIFFNIVMNMMVLVVVIAVGARVFSVMFN